MAALVASWVFVLVDAKERMGWPYFHAGRHWTAMLGVYALGATLVALFLLLLQWLQRRLTATIARRWPRARAISGPAFYGLCAALISIPIGISTFSGERIGETAIGRAGPYVFAACIALGTTALTTMAWAALRYVEQGRTGRALGIVAGFLLLSSAAIYVDLRMYVALYRPLHTLLEVSAALVIGAAVAVLLALVVARFPAAPRTLSVVAAAALVWTASMVLIRPVRVWVDEALHHVWLEELYAGRMMRRIQIVEAFLSDPRGWRGIEMARIERLRKRYDITTTALSPAWNAAANSSLDDGATLRVGTAKLGVLVYYVDTLRYDVAADPKLMPSVVEFARGALDFRRAYAAGSDTIRSLPALTGGSYDLSAVPEDDLLRVARRNGMPTVLFIAKSAYEFLAKLRPSFRFDRTVTVADYPPEREVWGYGAETPTSGALVDEALAWLADHRKESFLLWLFNFDLHNWRELDQRYVDEAARRFSVPDEGDLNWRYRVVARAIDAEFGRLMRGLESLGLDDRLIVLFVSDHGESLGRDGFWVHSVFLWEPLVRVPLVLRIPGVPALAYGGVVSLVDVAPTLGRYIEPDLDVSGYHGEDLLTFVADAKRARHRPVLLSASSRDVLVRTGLVEPSGRFKLVLSLEAALPELYDLTTTSDPDAVNVADEHPAVTLRLLSHLVESPVFPRSPADFDNTRPPRE